MKRTIKNIVLWLLVVVLLAVLYSVMYPGRIERMKQEFLQPSATGELQSSDSPAQINLLLEEKQRIENQIYELKQEINAVKAAATPVMLLFSTLDESMIQEAAAMMDQRGLTGIMGVSHETLQEWIDSGVPGFVNERLNAGWELCIILEDEPVELMQNRLKELNLPRAIAGYMLGSIVINDAKHLLENGVSIVLDDGMRVHSGEDGLWHVPAIGSMNSSGLSIYEARKNTGEAIVYISGDLRGDQQYIKLNMEGLLAMIEEDRKAGMVQNLKLQPAMEFCLSHAEKVAQYQEGWDQRERELQNQLTDVLQRIGSVGQ